MKAQPQGWRWQQRCSSALALCSLRVALTAAQWATRSGSTLFDIAAGVAAEWRLNDFGTSVGLQLVYNFEDIRTYR